MLLVVLLTAPMATARGNVVTDWDEKARQDHHAAGANGYDAITIYSLSTGKEITR
jgi:hypothetical protein